MTEWSLAIDVLVTANVTLILLEVSNAADWPELTVRDPPSLVSITTVVLVCPLFIILPSFVEPSSSSDSATMTSAWSAPVPSDIIFSSEATVSALLDEASKSIYPCLLTVTWLGVIDFILSLGVGEIDVLFSWSLSLALCLTALPVSFGPLAVKVNCVSGVVVSNDATILAAPEGNTMTSPFLSSWVNLVLTPVTVVVEPAQVTVPDSVLWLSVKIVSQVKSWSPLLSLALVVFADCDIDLTSSVEYVWTAETALPLPTPFSSLIVSEVLKLPVTSLRYTVVAELATVCAMIPVAPELEPTTFWPIIIG